MTRRSTARRTFGVVLAAGLALTPVLATAGALDLYYERSVMVAADSRCNLFTPPISAALAASKAQARGAALRSGIANEGLVEVERRAASKAGAVACDSPDIATAAARVRQAFEGFARLTRLSYPGEMAGWMAERAQPQPGLAAWGLKQTAKFGWDRMDFGLALRDGRQSLLAVASFADNGRPYTARLVMRDTARAPQPYLDGRNTDANGRIPLSDRAAPRSASLVFTAEARSAAGRDLIGEDGAAGWAFRFPAAAATALAGLDPRESVTVEFVFQGAGGDLVKTAYVEVGDFAAGRAFLAASATR
ncbi:MAG: hypothetical protein U1E50_07725 [Caulobacteraceae bacterium]